MATVILCDRCGAVIKTAIVKQVGFTLNPRRMSVYDVCDKCYDELDKCMKINKEEHNG